MDTDAIHQNRGQTELSRLELEHAQKNSGTLEDIEHSNALTTVQAEFSTKYLLRMGGALSSIGLGTVAAYWGFSPPAAILTHINADIGPSDNASLFAIIWTAACAVSIILFGRLSDKFGRRYFMLGASGIGVLGGIIAATAQDMNTLIGANVFLGLSGGVHTCYTLTAGEICPNKYKFLGITFAVIPSCLSTGFGAYIALRLVNTGAGWRWCYYSYLIMMAFAFVLQFMFYHPPTFQQLHGGKRTVMEEVKRIDFVGALLLATGLTLFLLGISWGGSPAPWISARILSLVIVGGVLIIIFVFWEIYSGVPNPLVPMYFFKDLRGFLCLVTICGFSGVSYVGPSIIWPTQVAAIYGVNATNWEDNAWLSTTIAFGIIGGIYVWGPMISVVKHVRIQIIVMASITCIFSGALAASNQNNKGLAAAFSFLTTFPNGILELIPAALVQMDANDADLGTVFAILFTMRTVLGSIFTAIYLAILNNKLPAEIHSHVQAAAIAAGLPSSSFTSLFAAVANGTAAAYNTVPQMTPEIEAKITEAVLDGRVKSYSYIYYATIAVNAMPIIAGLLMKNYDHLMNSHVPRQIYRNGQGAGGDEKVDKKIDEEAANSNEAVDLEGKHLENHKTSSSNSH